MAGHGSYADRGLGKINGGGNLGTATRVMRTGVAEALIPSTGSIGGRTLGGAGESTVVDVGLQRRQGLGGDAW
jgi:hypothetical protein